MKQIVKNTNNQKTPAGAALVDQYNENTRVKSHVDVDLTPRRTHGLTRNHTYLRDIEQVKNVYLHLRRLKSGARLRMLNDWRIITDAPGVVLSPAAMQALADRIYRTDGPGTLGKYNEHVKQAANKKTGIVPGSDGNYRACSVRRLGAFYLRRRDSEKSEYRMLKVANEVVRIRLQEEEGVYFPDTDGKREAERKKEAKLLRSEELALDEWKRIQNAARTGNGELSIHFGDSHSLLRDTATAHQALRDRGYEFTARAFSVALVDDSNPFNNHLFKITHPDWAAKRAKNAKKPISSKSRPPECSVDMLLYLVEARQLVREYHRKYLADLEKAKEQSSPAEVPAPIPASVGMTPGPEREPVVQSAKAPENPVRKELPISDLVVVEIAVNPPIANDAKTDHLALVRKSGFQTDNYLVPAALIKAVEGLDRPLMRDGQDARQLFEDIGWPVAKEHPQPNELILNHDGQVIRLPLDDTLAVIQLALARAKILYNSKWTKTADVILGEERLGDMHVNSVSYLDPFHSSFLELERYINDDRWFHICKLIDRASDPLSAIVKFCKDINDYTYLSDPEKALQLAALHYRTNPCGFLNFISLIRRQFLGPERALPPFVSPVPPSSLPTLKRLTTEILTNHLVNPGSQNRRCLNSLDDFRDRLAASGFSMKSLDNDTIEITAVDYEPLTVNLAPFIINAQRQILRRILAFSAGNALRPPMPLDLEYQNATNQESAPWNFPLFGAFWEEAGRICAKPDIAQACLETIRISANISNRDKRLHNIVGWWQDEKVRAVEMVGGVETIREVEKINAFAQFVLLNAHCGASLKVGTWMLSKKLVASPEFRPEELGFTLTKAGVDLQNREAKRALLQKKLQLPDPPAQETTFAK